MGVKIYTEDRVTPPAAAMAVSDAKNGEGKEVSAFLPAERPDIPVKLIAKGSPPLNVALFSPRPPSRDMKKAVEAAVGRLRPFLLKKNAIKDSHVILGPNFDQCYRWRLGGTGGWDGFGRNESQVARQRSDAILAGLPDLDTIPKELTEMIHHVNLQVREEDAVRRDKLIVLKHFPGGADLESTESKELFIDATLASAELTFMSPFVSAITKSPAPRALMISHAIYGFEGELKKSHPELQRYCMGDEPMIASFSPAIIRGYLRKTKGFKGMIVSDWYDMVAVEKNIDRLKVFKIGGTTVKDRTAKKIVLAVMAGVNWAGGVKTYKSTIEELEGLYKNEPAFREIFDENAKENLALALEVMGRQAPDVDITKLSVGDKVALLIRRGGGDKEIKKINSWFKEPADPWNRGGVITMVFMKNVVGALNNKEYPEPTTVPTLVE